MYMQMVPEKRIWGWSGFYYDNMDGFSGMYIGDNDLITFNTKLDAQNQGDYTTVGFLQYEFANQTIVLRKTNFTLATSVNNVVLPEWLFDDMITWLNSFTGITVKSTNKDFEDVDGNDREFIKFKDTKNCDDVVRNQVPNFNISAASTNYYLNTSLSLGPFMTNFKGACFLMFQNSGSNDSMIYLGTSYFQMFET